VKYPLKNKLNRQKGSITIEAALILPLVISCFVFGFSLMYTMFSHVKIQNHLNQLCVDLSYSSYVFHELGIVDKIQKVYQSEKEETLTYEELKEFVQITQPLLEHNPPNTTQLPSITSPFVQKNTSKSQIESVENLIRTITIWTEEYNTLLSLAKKMPSTIKTESLYYLTSQLGRAYFQDKLQAYCTQERIRTTIYIKHLELFFEKIPE
jgi:SUMO ligase MMS21 Smc5/6 complex component